MENFFTQHWQLVISFISLLLIVLGFFIKQMFSSSKTQANKMEKRLKEVEKEVKDIKDNYVERFEEVIQKLNGIAIDVATIKVDVKAQKDFCRFIQEQKIEK